MTTSGNFTPDEWNILADTPVVVGKAMINASHSGIIGSTEEVRSLAGSIKDMTKQMATSPFLNDLGTELQNKVNFTKDLGNTLADELRSIIKKPANTDAHDLALEACHDASAILGKASPEDSRAYKDFVVSTAQKVAEAAREGGLVRLSGSKVSPEEQTLLEEVKTALGPLN